MRRLVSSGLLAAILALGACTPKEEAPLRSIDRRPAPEFTLPDSTGKPVNSQTFKGKTTIICFWASWSPSSARQIPDLIALQDKWRDRNIQVVGIALVDSASDVNAFAKDTPIPFPVLIAPSQFHEKFGGINQIPATFVINPGWQIVNRFDKIVTMGELEAELNVIQKETAQAQMANN